MQWCDNLLGRAIKRDGKSVLNIILFLSISTRAYLSSLSTTLIIAPSERYRNLKHVWKPKNDFSYFSFIYKSTEKCRKYGADIRNASKVMKAKRKKEKNKISHKLDNRRRIVEMSTYNVRTSHEWLMSKLIDVIMALK